MDEQPRALEVREELVAEADALARSFDQAGDVGDDELAAVRRLDRPEHGRERRERVLGDLRPRVRDARQERRLAGVRQADERGVGEELEAQLDLLLLAGETDLGVARRLPARAGEVLVAAAACPARGDDDARTRACEVGDELVSREDLRADGNGELGVVAARAVRQAAAAATTAPGAHLLVRAEAGEVAPPQVGDEHDIAAVPAVTAVGAAARDVLLPPKVDRAVAPAASYGTESCAIVEHRGARYCPRSPRPTCAGAATSV